MNWKHWRKTKVMDGVIDHRYDNHQAYNPTQIVTEMKWKCHVQERLGTTKWFIPFPIFPCHFWLVPLYFLTSLRRITYAWCIILPFRWIHCYVNALTRLAKVKLILVMIDKVVTILCFNEFNDNENSIIFMFREFEKGQKENATSYFS